jgi:ribA/ribD-fused uncharacterized protein
MIMHQVYFWKPDQENGYMSQWSDDGFYEDGIFYQSAEHYMMSEKARLFSDVSTMEKIRRCHHPAEAKKLGRQVKGFDEKVWKANRLSIVVKGNMLKFTQNPSLAQKLINTDHSSLVEASPMDKIWGAGALKEVIISKGGYYTGKNLLGHCLVTVRHALHDLTCYGDVEQRDDTWI